MSPAARIAWHVGEARLAQVRNRPCRECELVHGPGTCPECGACDFTANIAGVRQCWNCDHVSTD